MTLSREEARQRRRERIAAERRSPVLALLLAVLLGPLGCLYVNPVLAIPALMLAGALGYLYWPAVAAVWLACAVYAPFKARALNRRLRRRGRWAVP